MTDSYEDAADEEPCEPLEPIEPLDADGRKLWDALTADYEFRDDQLRTLSSACALADMITRMETELRKSSLLVPGSRPGMLVGNALIGEIRQARVSRSSLLRSLKIPDDEEEDETPKRSRSEINRANAGKRWTHRYGIGSERGEAANAQASADW